MSDTFGSNINGSPDPKNMILELGIYFLSGLQAEKCLLSVWVATILNNDFRLSDTFGSKNNGFPDPENMILELGVFFLSGLQAEICLLPIWVAAILVFGLPVAQKTNRNSFLNSLIKNT